MQPSAGHGVSHITSELAVGRAGIHMEASGDQQGERQREQDPDCHGKLRKGIHAAYQIRSKPNDPSHQRKKGHAVAHFLLPPLKPGNRDPAEQGKCNS